MANSVNNVQIVPVNVFWQMEQTEVFDFTGLLATGLAGKCVKIYSANDESKYYACYNTLTSLYTATAVITKIEVAIEATDTATAIAEAFALALDANVDFNAKQTGATVTVARTAAGATTESVNANGGTVLITVARRGRDMDLGILQGDIEPSFSPSNYILTGHQYGKTPLAAFNQGFEKIEVTTTLMETHKSQLKEIYAIYGGSETPVGGTEVFGVGTISQGKNMMTEAGRVVMKPVTATDDTKNFNIMMASPVPDSLTFSGENPRVLKVTWQGFVDREFNEKFNAIAIGDINQSGL